MPCHVKTKWREELFPYDPVEDFWSQVEKTETCWLWCGNRRGKYGVFQGYLAHIVAWVLSGRRMLKRWEKLHHRCEVQLCVRPEHLIPLSSRRHRWVHTMPLTIGPNLVEIGCHENLTIVNSSR